MIIPMKPTYKKPSKSLSLQVFFPKNVTQTFLSVFK